MQPTRHPCGFWSISATRTVNHLHPRAEGTEARQACELARGFSKHVTGGWGLPEAEAVLALELLAPVQTRQQEVGEEEWEEQGGRRVGI